MKHFFLDTSLWRVDNILWTLLFGWLIAIGYLIAGVLMSVTVVGIPYGKVCWQLAGYFLWPFGKYIVSSEDDVRLNTSVRNYGSMENGNDTNNKNNNSDDDDNEDAPILEAKIRDDSAINASLVENKHKFKFSIMHIVW